MHCCYASSVVSSEFLDLAQPSKATFSSWCAKFFLFIFFFFKLQLSFTIDWVQFYWQTFLTNISHQVFLRGTNCGVIHIPYWITLFFFFGTWIISNLKCSAPQSMSEVTMKMILTFGPYFEFNIFSPKAARFDEMVSYIPATFLHPLQQAWYNSVQSLKANEV